ncbi:protein high arsenic content 1, mitochondrial, partial [Tanacetum coccineum]
MNSSMCITLIGRDDIYSGNPFPFIDKGIKVYKFNLDYVTSIKWVVELPFNARLLSSTSVADVVTVDVVAAKDLLDSGHRYLDVRTNEEFNKSHADNALNVPYMFITQE